MTDRSRANDRRLPGLVLLGALVATLAACGTGTTPFPTTTAGEDRTGTATAEPAAGLSGALSGAGATSQERAMELWGKLFGAKAPGVAVSYEGVGSGGGRERFLAGGVQLAGTDSALTSEEITAATARCFGGEVLELPLYTSPIAVFYNLPDLDAKNVNMSAETIAKIFSGQITSWDDPAIAAENQGGAFPHRAIVPVSRADESGTTENFTDYLAQASDGAWPYEASGDWPVPAPPPPAEISEDEAAVFGMTPSEMYDATFGATGTSGMIDAVYGTPGAIGYVDASWTVVDVPDTVPAPSFSGVQQAWMRGDLGTVALKVGDTYEPFSPEAAAKVVDASPRADDATDKRLVVKIDRTTTEAGTYPLVLISYSVACSVYDDASDAANVKAFLSLVASDEGQTVAADPKVAGSAPISANLQAEIQKAIDSISVKG